MTGDKVKAEEMHYKVESRIDGHWFSNEYVFATKEDAEQYCDGLIEDRVVEKCRLIGTSDPVNPPPKEG